jgi:peptide subunit release factor 1 (eRF1)
VLPQICRKHRMDGRRARVYERWLKRATAKQVRQIAKRAPDEIIPRRFNGHSD